VVIFNYHRYFSITTGKLHLPSPYPIRNPRNIRHLSTRFTLSVERIRTGVLDAAPMLTVTFHQYLEPETFRIDETAERRRRERGNVNRFQALSASELESLCAQMDRTTCWRNVHTIRLIRWRVGGTVEYTLEFVSTDEHGNEVTSPLDAVVQNPRRIELLESGFLERLGLRRYDVHLATARHRWETICDSMSTRPTKLRPGARVDHNRPLLVFVRVHATQIQLVLHIIDCVPGAFFRCNHVVWRWQPHAHVRPLIWTQIAPIPPADVRVLELGIAFHFFPLCKRHARRDRTPETVVVSARRDLVLRKHDGEGLFLRLFLRGRPQHDNLAERPLPRLRLAEACAQRV
jgi:hypothetical protein